MSLSDRISQGVNARGGPRSRATLRPRPPTPNQALRNFVFSRVQEGQDARDEAAEIERRTRERQIAIALLIRDDALEAAQRIVASVALPVVPAEPPGIEAIWKPTEFWPFVRHSLLRTQYPQFRQVPPRLVDRETFWPLKIARTPLRGITPRKLFGGDENVQGTTEEALETVPHSTMVIGLCKSGRLATELKAPRIDRSNPDAPVHHYYGPVADEVLVPLKHVDLAIAPEDHDVYDVWQERLSNLAVCLMTGQRHLPDNLLPPYTYEGHP